MEKCITENGAKQLKYSSEEKHDVKLLAELAGKDLSSLIAYEMMYHRSCYRLYTKQINKIKDNDEKTKLEVFERFITNLNDELTNNHRVLWMKDLIKRYDDMHREASVTTKVIWSRDLKKKIEQRFNEKLSFYMIPGQGEIVYSSASSGTIVSSMPKSDAKKIEDCVSIIRNEISIKKVCSRIGLRLKKK